MERTLKHNDPNLEITCTAPGQYWIKSKHTGELFDVRLVNDGITCVALLTIMTDFLSLT